MPYSLSNLAAAIGQRRLRRHTRRQLAEILADRHLADDLGLAHTPRPAGRVEPW